MAFPSPHILPFHLRRGLLRIYIAVSVPWVAFFGYKFLDALQRPYQHHAAGAFWSLLIVPVGGPISLLVIMWVLAGFRKSQTASEATTSAGIDTRSSQPNPKGPTTDTRNTKSTADYAGAGKGLGKIFFEPDIWHEMNKLHERDKTTNHELALARVAIIRDAIRRLQPQSVAIQMSAGVDQYVAGVFAKPERLTTVMIAVQLYEQNVLPVTQLANVLVRRLSHSGVTAIEIAPLLEMVTAEAEQLMKASSALQKLNDLTPG
jgi:hypothetical protein